LASWRNLKCNNSPGRIRGFQAGNAVIGFKNKFYKCDLPTIHAIVLFYRLQNFPNFDELLVATRCQVSADRDQMTDTNNVKSSSFSDLCSLTSVICLLKPDTCNLTPGPIFFELTGNNNIIKYNHIFLICNKKAFHRNGANRGCSSRNYRV